MFIRKNTGSVENITHYYTSFFYYNPKNIFYTRSSPDGKTTALYHFDEKEAKVFEEGVNSIVPLGGEYYGFYDFGASTRYGLNFYNIFGEK